LLKNSQKWRWDVEQIESFKILQAALMREPVLQYPDFTKPFVLTTDASGFAVGAILSQGTIGQDKPIAFASRTLNQAEQNYSTIEKELTAIVWACRYFRPYLLGKHFTIVTDHRPLTWMFSVKDPSSRLLRWRLLLEEYDYTIAYKAGKKNVNADALSRNPVVMTVMITLKEKQ
jgi:glutathione S-transferase